MPSSDAPYSLVAHRGQPLTFPENSIQGYQHVIDSGVKILETDINFTADLIPVLSHDADLTRIAGKTTRLAEIKYEELADISAGYPARFGSKYPDYRVAPLTKLVELLQTHSDVRCCVELKIDELPFPYQQAVDIVAEIITAVADQVILISFDYDTMAYAKQKYAFPIGWVLPAWSEDNHIKSTKLAPDYLLVYSDFCPQTKDKLWTGNWQWMAYTANDMQAVARFSALGITLIETDRYSQLIEELAEELTG